MSNDATGEHQRPAEVGPPAEQRNQAYQYFILRRELAEVYLLLDNLSGSATKELDPEGENGPSLPLDATGKAPDWIKEVCQIAWPPPASQEDQAQDISTLIRVRDFLNGKAAPATGATIAFTLLVADEGKSGGTAEDNQVGGPARGWGNGEPLSRVDLAKRAFPGLMQSAQRFRRYIQALSFGLFAWLIVTCFLSWDVATGNALLAQLSNADTAKTQIEGQIADAENGTNNDQGGNKLDLSAVDDLQQTDDQSDQGSATPKVKAPGQSSTSKTQHKPILRFCVRSEALGPYKATASGKSYPQFESPIQRRLCDAYSDRQQSHDTAIANLKNWTAGWMWLHDFRLPGCLSTCAAQDASNNEQWTSSLLSVLGSAVLPIFYGLLGAGAAVVRSLSSKMKEGSLAPRDRPMSLIQLALGAVIGACIGLFVAPTGTTADATANATSGLLSAVHLSASALCFIAGFFVEGVFVALEGLMRRLFNIPDQPKRVAP
jgi:hypothetical protein